MRSSKNGHSRGPVEYFLSPHEAFSPRNVLHLIELLKKRVP